MSRGNSPAREGAARLIRVIRWLFCGLLLAASLDASERPPEPEGYRTDDYRAPTPDTVAGGVVLDTEAAHKLWTSGDAVRIDVLPAPRRPANLPQSAVWMPLPHRAIPSSLWLPDGGRSPLGPELGGSFRD